MVLGSAVSIQIAKSDFLSAMDIEKVISTGCPGDFDGDGDVDGSDLAVFASDFGRTDCPKYQRAWGVGQRPEVG